MHPLEKYQTQLITDIQNSASQQASDWLAAALEKLRMSSNREETLLRFSAMARRKLGTDLSRAETNVIEIPQEVLNYSHWSTSDAGRTVLLMEAIILDHYQSIKWVDTLFRHGDEIERAAIIQALALLPSPESLKHIALEAGRTNSLRLYAALALKNPYITTWYDEHEFNQVVLKSLFTGMIIELICGLQKRSNRELSRMCEAYTDERLAAGRSLPSDIWLAIGPYASKHGEQLMIAYLHNEDPQHRHYAAIALGRRLGDNPTLLETLKQRLSDETDAHVLETLKQQLI